MAGQVGKVLGNQIVKTVKFYTHKIDCNCHGASQSPGQREAMGVCVFRMQVRPECDTWHFLEARGNEVIRIPTRAKGINVGEKWQVEGETTEAGFKQVFLFGF